MKNKLIKALVIIFVVIVFISLVIGQNFFFELRAWLSGTVINHELTTLRADNLSLRARLDELTARSAPAAPTAHSRLSAFVYASYPFNDKSTLTIDAGAAQNISPTDAVTVADVLIGQVSAVLPDYSIVRTVFDPAWEFPVYLGPKLARGLFQGGVDPKVVLVSKREELAPGDLITTADPKLLPTRLVVGTVGQLVGEASSPFWEVSVNLPYNINNLRQVFIYSYGASDR